MASTQKARKEPTVSFSVRCPVSMEKAAVTMARRLKLERNGYVVAALVEKIARDRDALRADRYRDGARQSA